MMYTYDTYSILAEVMILFNRKLGRRSLSDDECINIQAYLRDNKNIASRPYDKEKFNEYFDEVYVKKGEYYSIYYRLKPNITINELRDAYPFIDIELLKLIDNEEFLTRFSIYSLEDEQEIKEFQKLDEKAELETLEELSKIELEQRRLTKKLDNIRANKIEKSKAR